MLQVNDNLSETHLSIRNSALNNLKLIRSRYGADKVERLVKQDLIYQSHKRDFTIPDQYFYERDFNR